MTKCPWDLFKRGLCSVCPSPLLPSTLVSQYAISSQGDFYRKYGAGPGQLPPHHYRSLHSNSSVRPERVALAWRRYVIASMVAQVSYVCFILIPGGIRQYTSCLPLRSCACFLLELFVTLVRYSSLRHHIHSFVVRPLALALHVGQLMSWLPQYYFMLVY